MAMTDFLQNKFLDASLRNTGYTGAATVYMALYSTSPTESTAGTELSGSGYARQSVTFAAPSTGTAVSSSTVTFGPATATWTLAVAVGIVDASTGGNVLYYRSINNTVANGTSLVFDSGDVEVVLT